MASRNTAGQRSLTRGVVVIDGSFAPNGSSALSAASRQGNGYTVARTSAGLFTVTLSDKFSALVSATATLQLATAADVMVQIGTVVIASKTIQIRCWDFSDGAVADVAADANNRINFTFKVKNTALLPVRG